MKPAILGVALGTGAVDGVIGALVGSRIGRRIGLGPAFALGCLLYGRTPDRIRARSGGAFRFINYGTRPIGAVLGGWFGGAIGVREALFIATIAATAGVLWLVGSPVLRLRVLPDAPE